MLTTVSIYFSVQAGVDDEPRPRSRRLNHRHELDHFMSDLRRRLSQNADGDVGLGGLHSDALLHEVCILNSFLVDLPSLSHFLFLSSLLLSWTTDVKTEIKIAS
jgi:hypothetical protein